MRKKSNTAKIDWKILNTLLQFKVTLKFCADYLNMSEDKIERSIRKEFDKTFSQYHELKLARTGLKLQQKAIEMALSGDRTMLIFSLKNICKWSDTQEQDFDKESEFQYPIVD